MRGKGRARIVLFATVGIDACVWLNGCAKAGSPDEPQISDAATDANGGALFDGETDAPVQVASADGATSEQEPGEASSETAPDTSASDGARESSAPSGDDADASAGDDGEVGPVADAAADESDAPAEPSDGGAVSSPEASSTGADASQDATVGTSSPEASVSDGGDSGFDATIDAGSAASLDAAVDAACGGCQAGFSCGASGYCVSSTGVPAFGHVYVIVMEEQSLSAIQGSASAPYLNSLIASYALATNYTAPDHPSLPNYLELTSGSPQGVVCDCAPGGTPTCSLTGSVCSPILPSNCDCPQAAAHLGDEFDTAGIAWREYAEGMGAPCNIGGADGGANFAPSHVPFLYYDNVYTAPGRCVQRVRDYGDFASDLASGSYAFSMISPDTCHDMQVICTGTQVLQGDDWLSVNVPPILATPGFASGGHDVLLIVWEEAGTDVLTPPVPLVVVSPLARATTTSAPYTHYSLLATIEDGLGVPRLGNSSGVAPVSDVWK
jgi:phosphatidylinositol-3-phosphatase